MVAQSGYVGGFGAGLQGQGRGWVSGSPLALRSPISREQAGFSRQRRGCATKRRDQGERCRSSRPGTSAIRSDHRPRPSRGLRTASAA